MLVICWLLLSHLLLLLLLLLWLGGKAADSAPDMRLQQTPAAPGTAAGCRPAAQHKAREKPQQARYREWWRLSLGLVTVPYAARVWTLGGLSFKVLLQRACKAWAVASG
jgi:hypothetical protein